MENRDNLKFWRLKSGVEVDFIQDEEVILPIEVKLKETDSTPSGLSSFLNAYPKKTGWVANQRIRSGKNRVTFIPYYLL